MYKIKITLLFLSLLIWSNNSFADGKFYHENVPPEVPYQRALLMFDKEYETLILQSKYQIHESEKTEFIGWVVPVPSVPELASMDAKYASQLFYQLSASAKPEVIFISQLVLLALPVASLLTLLKFPYPVGKPVSLSIIVRLNCLLNPENTFAACCTSSSV